MKDKHNTDDFSIKKENPHIRRTFMGKNFLTYGIDYLEYLLNKMGSNWYINS